MQTLNIQDNECCVAFMRRSLTLAPKSIFVCIITALVKFEESNAHFSKQSQTKILVWEEKEPGNWICEQQTHVCSILAPHPGSRVWFQMTLSYWWKLFSPAAASRRRCQLCCSFIIVSSLRQGDETLSVRSLCAFILFCTALLIFSYISSTDNFLLLLSVSYSSFVFSFLPHNHFLFFIEGLIWFDSA